MGDDGKNYKSERELIFSTPFSNTMGNASSPSSQNAPTHNVKLEMGVDSAIFALNESLWTEFNTFNEAPPPLKSSQVVHFDLSNQAGYDAFFEQRLNKVVRETCAAQQIRTKTSSEMKVIDFDAIDLNEWNRLKMMKRQKKAAHKESHPELYTKKKNDSKDKADENDEDSHPPPLYGSDDEHMGEEPSNVKIEDEEDMSSAKKPKEVLAYDKYKLQKFQFNFEQCLFPLQVDSSVRMFARLLEVCLNKHKPLKVTEDPVSYKVRKEEVAKGIFCYVVMFYFKSEDLDNWCNSCRKYH